jgi:hypothetical protein
MLTGHVLPRLTNMSHVVNKLAFGPEFPGQVNPLDGTIRMAKEGGKLFAYRYFVKVRRRLGCGVGGDACGVEPPWVYWCVCVRRCVWEGAAEARK